MDMSTAAPYELTMSGWALVPAPVPAFPGLPPAPRARRAPRMRRDPQLARLKRATWRAIWVACLGFGFLIVGIFGYFHDGGDTWSVRDAEHTPIWMQDLTD